MLDFTLDIIVDQDAEVKELKSQITLPLDDGVKLPENVVGDLRRALAEGTTGIFEYHFTNAFTAGAGYLSCHLHLTNKLRKIMPALRATYA